MCRHLRASRSSHVRAPVRAGNGGGRGSPAIPQKLGGGYSPSIAPLWARLRAMYARVKKRGGRFDRVGVDPALLARFPPLNESVLAERDDGVLGGFEVSESALQPDPSERKTASALRIEDVDSRGSRGGDGC